MFPSFSRAEAVLLGAVLLLGLLAIFAPPLAQAPHFHDFADQRSWLGLPCALDVLSNLPFALFGAWGLRALGRVPATALPAAQRQLATLFFAGLILTALCSSWYHWAPDNAGLAVDRLGMTVAFAGLLGLGVASHVSTRAGQCFAWAVLLCGPLSVWVWTASGNLLPWALLQGGGLLLLLVLAVMKPLPGALAVRWGLVVAIYAVAKALEQYDAAVFEWTGQLVSGHSLKHLVAAFAAWPVISALHLLGQNAKQ
ncbi:hypothetical protein [Curvibacter sp. PAE-UM]|uniref:hypothetical protein n=1 Tax=Curvibacter sp. PAE-UM TaxID=1714344 RepID=UPI00070B58D7|nr:hypothetical protein [Curvibacter sp. PAE-UM]KRH99931.1 hypothetical protein AO057_02000 [Curvibacter sp. PAE-UM]